MAVTHTFSIGWTNGSEQLSASNSVSNNQEISIDDQTIGGETTDTEISLPFAYARLKSVYMESTEDITIETNDGTTPDDTITLSANAPLIWQSGWYFTNPFTADVTSIFVTNAGADAAVLNIRLLVDPTP